MNMRILWFLLAAATAANPAAAGEAQTQPRLARPTPGQFEYQEMERVMFVCLDPCTWQGREYDDHSTPLEKINPEKLDTDQWCRVARSWGAGEILFVAKHTGGFCWWQTQTSRYGIKETPWRGGKGDVLKDLSASCRGQSLKLGIYVYPGDDNWGAQTGGMTKDPARQEAYNKVYRQQLTETLSRYGEVSEVWFDGSVAIPVGDIIQKYAPKGMVFQGPHATIRWVGNERGYAPYPAWNAVKKAHAMTGVATAEHGDPDGDVWMPLEVDTTLRDHFWFWSPTNAARLKGLDQLMDCYYKSVGRGAVLLLDSAPDTSGLIPECDVKRYAEFGAEIRRRFGKSVAETSGRGKIVELALPRPTQINHAILMEDIREGERVRQYVLEAQVDGQWRQIVQGVSIGHKKIDLFHPVEAAKVRLRVTRSAAEPIIRRLAVFNVDSMTLPGPGAPGAAVWHKAGAWNSETTGDAWTTLDVDLSACIPRSGEHEVVVRAR